MKKIKRYSANSGKAKTGFIFSIKLFLGLFVFISAFIYAQPSQLWMRTYQNAGGTGTDVCEKSIIDAQGNSYMACETRTANTSADILVLKYNAAGALQWTRTYNYSYNGIEHPNDIALDNDGNIYVTGASTRTAGGYHDAILLKLDPNGNMLWVKRISKSNYNERKSQGISMVVGFYIFLGVNFVYNGITECGVVKYGLNGDSLAYFSYGGINNFSFRIIKVISDNSLNLYTISTGDLLQNEEEDFMIKKLNHNGSLTQVWSRIFTGSSHLDDRASDIVIGPDGNVFITGYTDVPNQSHNLLMLKLGRDDGAILMQKTYNDPVTNYMDYGSKICFDANSNIIVGGGTWVLNGSSDILLLKYSPSGTLLWTKKYEHPGQRYEDVIDMLTDNAGNIYVASNSHSQILQTTALVTSKFSSAGGNEWFIERPGQTTTNSASSLNMDTDGSLIVSGYIEEQDVIKTALFKYGSTIGIEPVSSNIPAQFSLSQNYPNPFNPTTNIRLELPKEGFVNLAVFDVTGKQVALLVNENLNAGEYNIDFNASGLTSGVYFYKVVTNDFTDVKKMILVK